MRNTLRVSVLVLSFCYPAFAGDIPCPIVAPTPDSYAQDGAAAAVTFFEVVLNLLALS
jgi:hypothetical protein